MTADQLAAELAYRIAEREEQIRTKPSGNMKKETNDTTVGSHDLLADSPTCALMAWCWLEAAKKVK